MIDSFKKWWIYLTGSSNDISIENRTFNAVSLICLVYLLSMVFSNIALGLHTMAIWIIIMVGILAVLFYLSRFTTKFTLSSYIFAALSYPAIAGIYILNAGLSGPSTYGFLLSFVVLIIITPRKTHLLWFFLHSVIVCSLFYIEMAKPEWIVFPYRNRTEHIIDLSLSFVPVLLFIYLASTLLRRGYFREKKLAEQRLNDINIKKAELEYSHREKDRLFSIIGHDLRSPLNSIQGFLEILNSTDLSPEDRNEIQLQLHDLTANTSHLLNNLLLWSSKTGSELKLSSLDLHEITMEVVNLIQPEAYKKNVKITCVAHTDRLLVSAEKDMLQLIIRNLLSNAVKFTPEKGKVNLWCESNEGSLSIHVQDEGIGIPNHKKPDIFTSRAKSTKGTAQESGIGLGLVLCQEFITAMNGSISFESKENVGSTFVITLAKGDGIS